MHAFARGRFLTRKLETCQINLLHRMDTAPTRHGMLPSHMPDVNSLKLVPAEEISRLPAYAGEVLNQNERLARYMQFVASLERQNQVPAA
jgi:hypothetical protein